MPPMRIRSSENVFYFIEQILLRLVLDRSQCVQLLQKLALALVQLLRGLRADFNIQVALLRAVQYRNAFVADAEARARLCSVWNLQLVVAIHRRDLDLCAKRQLREAHRDGAIKIIAFALKERVLLHMQHHVEVTRRTAVRACLTLVGVANASSVFYASRNLYIQRAFVK